MSLLIELSNAIGVSGNEKAISGIIRRELKPCVDKIFTDSMGNLVGVKRGSPPRVMLAAHMDEIGLMVSRIKKNGLIGFAPVGGFDAVTIMGHAVWVEGKQRALRGVVSCQELHRGKIMREAPKMEELYVDTGLSQQELEKEGVGVGSYISFERVAGELGNSEMIIGKALDDRIGCYVLIELAKKLKKTKNETYFVFTVQEEVGLYGAKTSAYQISPDWAIAVDTTAADDVEEEEKTRVVGQGPCLTVMDAEMITNKCIDEWLEEIAKKQQIPLQLQVTTEGTTDAITISISRGGIPSSVIAIPIRNIHSTVGVASKKDIENAVKLLYELLKKPPKTCFF